MTRSGLRRLVGLGAALAAVLAVIGCQATVAHEFGAYGYDPIDDCLVTPGVIDVIAGADPGSCPMLRCWQSPCGTVYVTDQACDAPANYQDMTHASSGPCVKALAAYARKGHGVCASLSDGGLGCGL